MSTPPSQQRRTRPQGTSTMPNTTQRTYRSSASRRVRLCVALGAAAAAIMLGGCNILGPAFVLAHGPPKIYRATTLDKTKTVAIFIDDPMNLVPRTNLRAIMGEEAEELLLKKKLVADAKSARSTIAAASQARGDEQLSITAIGRLVGADQVIWVGIEQFTLSPDGESFRPTVRALVKIIDVAEDRRVWPTSGPGYPLVIERAVRPTEVPSSRSQAEQMHVELAKHAGRGIAELFYDEERYRSARGGG